MSVFQEVGHELVKDKVLFAGIIVIVVDLILIYIGLLVT
jgi:hypothetical protein